MRICTQLAACIADRRDPSRVVHALDDILRARVLAINLRLRGCRRPRYPARRSGFPPGAWQAAGFGARPCQSADDEPLGERADHARAGTADAGADRDLLRQLSGAAQASDARHKRQAKIDELLGKHRGAASHPSESTKPGPPENVNRMKSERRTPPGGTQTPPFPGVPLLTECLLL